MKWVGAALLVMVWSGVAPRPLPAAPSSVAPHERAHLQASITPSQLKLGERATYRGRVVLLAGVGVHFESPVAGGAYSWGKPVVKRGRIEDPKSLDFGKDSVVVRIPIQIFETGIVSVPGLRLQLDRLAPSTQAVAGRLPVVRVIVTPTVTAADSAAELHPVRGPLVAPWWERIAWGLVLAAAVLLAGITFLIGWWRRRKPKPTPVRAPTAGPRVRRDPTQVALASLAALRAKRLPEQGQYGEHALSLTRILREYLEATLVTPRPGDTSAELLQRLAGAALPAEDVGRLEGLLGFWDRVKFARAPMGLEEARRCEDAVEALVRRGEHSRGVA